MTTIVELSNEQRQELAQRGDRPLRVLDPDTNKVYFIIAGDVFERIAAVFSDDSLNASETYAAQSAAAGAAGWDDPEMDVYNELPGPKLR